MEPSLGIVWESSKTFDDAAEEGSTEYLFGKFRMTKGSASTRWSMQPEQPFHAGVYRRIVSIRTCTYLCRCFILPTKKKRKTKCR